MKKSKGLPCKIAGVGNYLPEKCSKAFYEFSKKGFKGVFSPKTKLAIILFYLSRFVSE